MRPFVIDDQTRKALAELAEYANKHRIETDQMLDIYNGQAPPAGDNPAYVRDLHFGYRVVFTIEAQKQGWARHLSVGVPSEGKYPHPYAVQEIMKLLGFKTQAISGEMLIVYTDDASINVVEYL